MSKIWLITGAGRGLGRSILEAALAAGHRVVGTARDPDSLADLRRRYGDRLLNPALDVTNPAQVRRAVDVAAAAYGGLDVLVNNAGFGRLNPFEQIGEEDFRGQVETNFFGVVNMVRAALPVMRNQRAGHIINISSVGGRVATPGLSAYQAAKWAVGGFTEVLAQEVAPFGIKVTALEPGGMRTDWGYAARNAAAEILPDYEPSVGAVLSRMKAYVGNEIGDPDKIARLVVELATREKLPAHLLLGSDALHVFHQAEAARQKAADEWAEVSVSTDFDDTELPPMLRAAAMVEPKGETFRA